jgi:Fe-S protein, radical SAM family
LVGEEKQKYGSVRLEGEAEAYSLPPSKGIFLQYDSRIFAAGGVENRCGFYALTVNEWEKLRCKNFTSTPGGRRYLPYAFTEQGIYMLMTVLKGELATKQSKAK